MIRNTNIAIVGCGFSGLMTLHHLVRSATRPLNIRVYERGKTFGKGLAYATDDPQHLLNVPAERMGALPGRPEDFHRWLKRNRPVWSALHPAFAGLKLTRNSYVPRMIYGAYLSDILQRTLKLGRRYGHDVQLLPRAVTELQPMPGRLAASDAPQVLISDDTGNVWRADRVVLATGPVGARRDAFQKLDEHAAVLRRPWDPACSEAFWERFDRRPWTTRSHVVLLGTGLSMVDMLHSLHARGFPGHVTAVSRRGYLPRPQRRRSAGALHAADLLEFPRTANGLVAKLQRDMESLNFDGRDWRVAIDRMRGLANEIWSRFPMGEQRQFLRNHLAWWNSQRHRMPPVSFALVQSMLAAGRLTIRSGKLLHVGLEGDRLLMYVDCPTRDRPDCLETEAVIDARGFTGELVKTDDPLLCYLLRHELIVPDWIGWGVPTDGHHAVHGRFGGRLYALGPMLFGQRLETTAIQELREQASTLAGRLLIDQGVGHASAIGAPRRAREENFRSMQPVAG